MATITRRDNKDSIAYLIRTNFTDSNSGKKIRKSITWTAPKGMSEQEAKKAVEDVAYEFEKEVKENLLIGIEDNDFTVEQYSRIYIDYLTKNFSPTYYLGVKAIFEYINSKIGDVKLSKLTPGIIQAYFDDVDKSKKVEVIISPKPDFKWILEKNGFTYTILRRHLLIQHSTLTKAYKGNNVEIEWAETLCERTKLPFDLLFVRKREIEDYAFRTKHQRKIMLRQMLAYAKRQRVVKENYATADFVFYTRNKAIHQIQAMDEEQAKKFYIALDECEDIRIKTSLLLFLLTGFRRGEVVALNWSDIDFNKQKISINRAAIIAEEGKLVLKEPKTAKSQRTITVPTILMRQLELYRDWQNELIYQLGDLYHDQGFLFTKEDGDIMNPNTFMYWMEKILDDAGLPHFTIHSLRHTNITLQLLSGVPLVTVAGRAGHSRTSTTSDVYSHYVQSSDNGAALLLEKRFEEYKKEEVNEEQEILKLKKEANDNGFNNIKEYLDYLKQLAH